MGKYMYLIAILALLLNNIYANSIDPLPLTNTRHNTNRKLLADPLNLASCVGGGNILCQGPNITFSVCCPSYDTCCGKDVGNGIGFFSCIPPNAFCCADGVNVCYNNFDCCTNGCMPSGGICCGDNGYCPNGYNCIPTGATFRCVNKGQSGAATLQPLYALIILGVTLCLINIL